jgi:hypothetical protein
MNNISKNLYIYICHVYDLDDSDELPVDKKDIIITEGQRERGRDGQKDHESVYQYVTYEYLSA